MLSQRCRSDRSARCLIPSSIFRSMTSEPGSITSMPKRWPAAAPHRDPVATDQAGRAVPGDEGKGPDPVTRLGADREHPFGVEDLHPHPRSVLAAAQDIPDLEVLPLREDPVSAVHLEAEEVLDPVIGVGARTARAHLDQPRPDRRRRSVDPDRSRRNDVGGVEQVVPRQRPRRFVACRPQVSTHSRRDLR
jgi:hypothetical protein